MRTRTTIAAVAAVAALITAGGVTLPAFAHEVPAGEHATREPGNGPERNEIAWLDEQPEMATTQGFTAESTEPTESLVQTQTWRQRGYPRQQTLRVFPENLTDSAIKLGLLPYHAIAPKLNELQAASNRVSVEVIGQTAQGRDLYLVTVTAPERPDQTRQQDLWRRLIEDEPWWAARDRDLKKNYKAPIWINGNIHGDEYEGLDGSMRLIEKLATATDKATADLLKRTRVYFTVTNNPDGRVIGQRPNGNGFDLNRDYATGSQPEARANRDVMIATQPLVMLDEHGYTGTTLIEPATAPHGQNYDYDLYIRHAYPNALGMEAAIQTLGHAETTRADIPFRDFAPGDWDDWPPIFTPMYAMYHGAIGHTVEVPLQVNRGAYQSLPVAELQRRSRINVDVVEATIRAAIGYTDTNRDKLIADQIELFRRGWAGEAQRHIPDDYVPGFGPEDRYSTTFPRAYVIPTGSGQRSEQAAARLVDHLIANDLRVTRAILPFWLDGKFYPAGSYVVNMHQPKRGLVNALLDAGRDVSPLVPQMYDISGWSHGLLWGATVDKIDSKLLPVLALPVSRAGRTGDLPSPSGRDLQLTLTSERDVQAANSLLAQGVPARWTASGALLVPAAHRKAASKAAEQYGVRFTTASSGATGTAVKRPVIAAAVAADELFTLRELGFEVRTVSTALLNAGTELTGVDVLYVSAGLTYTGLNAAARARMDAFLATGGVVTRGATGARFNADARLLPVTSVAGRTDANGVVAVTNGNGLLGTGAQPNAFIFSPLYFTNIGAGVTVEQSYAAGNPLVAGHWLPNANGNGGPAQAAGQAAVVSGVSTRGTATAIFGTEPLFRNHPKGSFAQVSKAIFWATAAVPATV